MREDLILPAAAGAMAVVLEIIRRRHLPLEVSKGWREQQRRAEMKTQPERICWKWPVVTNEPAKVLPFERRRSA